MPSDAPGTVDRRQTPFLLLCGVVSFLTAGLVIYSQTASFMWDEGYHLLAAQLIMGGKTPYADFLFPQTPLNAYWNAGWMRIFGDSWRLAHALSALLTGAAVLLTADFVFRRLPVPRWRIAGALTAVFAAGLNVAVVGYGTLGQAYGLCLFLMVAAFRVSILAVDRNSPLPAGMGGLLAGGAAGSSLLTAPVVPVLALWIVLHDRAGKRWEKLAAFLTGSAIAFLPVLWLFVQAPRQVLFSVIEYQLLHRAVQWPHATRHNLEVMISWVDSSHALLLGLLAAAGLLFIVLRSDWDHRRKAELYLCGWMALALGVHISTAHPTFAWYYLLLVPFLSILAAAGLYWVGSRVYSPDRPLLPVVVFAVLLSLGLVKWLSEGRDYSWRDYETVARKVEQVTPPHGLVMADEQVYFLMRRTPPSGMELDDSHKLELPAAFAERLHIVTRTELHRRLKAGVFSTVQTCEDEDGIKELGLQDLYAQKAEFGMCTVFWDKVTLPRRENRT